MTTHACSAGQKMEVSGALKRLVSWFLDSGIQDDLPTSTSFGGYRAWYDAEARDYSFSYPEITGYALSTLSYLLRAGSDGADITSRMDMAYRYIRRTCFSQDGGHLEIGYLSSGNFSADRKFSFDAGMVLKGLLDLSATRRDADLVSYCVAIAEWLLGMQKRDGSFFPIFDAGLGSTFESRERWSSQPGSYHGKLAIPLLALYATNRRPRYRESAIRLLDWVLGKQTGDGRFRTCERHADTFLHAHCYSLEGLLFGALRVGKQEYYRGVDAGLRWLLRLWDRVGYFPSTVSCDDSFCHQERMDVLGQVLRLLAVSCAEGIVDRAEIESCCSYLLSRLEAYICKDEDVRANNGVFFAETVRHVNSWATMFAIQGLSEWLRIDETRGFCGVII